MCAPASVKRVASALVKIGGTLVWEFINAA
jgi:hypothetical protein